jgi:hypothetical protein
MAEEYAASETSVSSFMSRRCHNQEDLNLSNQSFLIMFILLLMYLK